MKKKILTYTEWPGKDDHICQFGKWAENQGKGTGTWSKLQHTVETSIFYYSRVWIIIGDTQAIIKFCQPKTSSRQKEFYSFVDNLYSRKIARKSC